MSEEQDGQEGTNNGQDMNEVFKRLLAYLQQGQHRAQNVEPQSAQSPGSDSSDDMQESDNRGCTEGNITTSIQDSVSSSRTDSPSSKYDAILTIACPPPRQMPYPVAISQSHTNAPVELAGRPKSGAFAKEVPKKDGGEDLLSNPRERPSKLRTRADKGSQVRAKASNKRSRKAPPNPQTMKIAPGQPSKMTMEKKRPPAPKTYNSTGKSRNDKASRTKSEPNAQNTVRPPSNVTAAQTLTRNRPTATTTKTASSNKPTKK